MNEEKNTITLETFPSSDDFYSTRFVVNKEWLMNHIADEYNCVEEFLYAHTWDETYFIYQAAINEKALVKSESVKGE